MVDIQQELDNILNELENSINTINNIDSINEFNTIYKNIQNYEKKIVNMNNTIKKIMLVKDSLNVVLNNFLLKKNNKKNNYKISNDDSNKISISHKNITNIVKYNNIDFVKFPVISISHENIDIIENTPLYYIKETKQYCIKINNNLIMGNIGNICFKKDNPERINKCKYDNCNKQFYEKKCKYFHNNINRNFSNYSWNHINKNKSGKVNNNNIDKFDLDNSRFIGSLDTIMEDLPFSSINEKDLRNNQLMHDILLYLILSKYLIH